MRQKLSKLEINIPDLEKMEQNQFQSFKKQQETVIKIKNRIHIKVPENMCCPHCSCPDFSKNGFSFSKKQNIKKQKYICNNQYCKKQFRFDVGFKGLKVKVTPEIIAQVMQLYFTGESLRNIAILLNMQGVKIQHVTVLNWIKKYTRLMKVFLDQFTPQVSDKWMCDELYLKINGKPKYLFAMMDFETRFIIAYYITDSKKTHNANKLLQIARAKAQKPPKIFVSDGLLSYKKAFLQEYWSPIGYTKHLRVTWSHQNKWMNNRMERFNGTFRQRSKTLRCLKKTDSSFIDGFIIYYNFIRHHTGINATPAEKAGISIEGNKWITIIQNAEIERSDIWQ